MSTKMFSWSLKNRNATRRFEAPKFLLAVVIGASCAVPSSYAQEDVKRSIVKIVTVGTQQLKDGTRNVDGYIGTGFIVYSASESGGAQTVIVTADHVLGYSLTKAQQPEMTFEASDVPIWVKRGSPECRAELRELGENPRAEEPCRRIDTYFLNDGGVWQKHAAPANVHRLGYRNQDYAVLWVKQSHRNLVPLTIGNTYDLDSAAKRKGSAALPPLQAWGVDYEKPDNDPFSTQLIYRSRDEGPTLILQNSLGKGNSGGPILFEGKVIGIVSAIQGDETRVTRIQTVYDALRSWKIESVQIETAATLDNARKALFNNDFGTAQRLLAEIWQRSDGPDESQTQRRLEKEQAARLLAKLNLEKLGNGDEALKWLRRLTEIHDHRALLEIALLPIFFKQVGGPDFLAGPSANKWLLSTTDVGLALGQLISSAPTAEHAMLACIYFKMDDEDREPSCSTTSPFSKMLRRMLLSTVPADIKKGVTRQEINEQIKKSPFGSPLFSTGKELDKIDELKKAHPLISLIERNDGSGFFFGKTDLGVVHRDDLAKAVEAGSVAAAIQVLSKRSLDLTTTDALTKLLAKIETAAFLDDKIYVVAEEFFRIIDNRPTRQDYVRGKAIAALAHILGKSKLPEADRLGRTGLLINDVDRLMEDETRTDSVRDTPFPHRLVYFVKALLAERMGDKAKSAHSIRKALRDWQKVPYLPNFARDEDVFSHAVRMVGQEITAESEPWLVGQIREECLTGSRCWVALSEQFDLLAEKLRTESITSVSELFVARVGKDLGFLGLDTLDSANLRKVATLAEKLSKRMQERVPSYTNIAALQEIKVRLDQKIAAAPCPAARCDVSAWKAISNAGNIADWQVFEGRTNWGAKTACRMSSNKGLFKRIDGGRARGPQLNLLTFGTDLSKQTIEFETGVKVRRQAASGEQEHAFVVGGQQFSTSIRNDGGTDVLFIDGASPNFSRLLSGLSSDHSLTIAYGREGETVSMREHVSLQGFDAAYAVLQKRCPPTTLSPVIAK